MRANYSAQIDLRIEIGTGRLPDGVIERREVERRMSWFLQEEINRLLIDQSFRDGLNEALGVGDDFELRLGANVRNSIIDERVEAA